LPVPDMPVTRILRTRETVAGGRALAIVLVAIPPIAVLLGASISQLSTLVAHGVRRRWCDGCATAVPRARRAFPPASRDAIRVPPAAGRR
jgi:hypothetical protein